MIHKTATISAMLIHGIHLVLRWGLMALAVLCIAGVIWLTRGISIDRLHLGGYEAKKVYLKLDKKLSLTAEYLVIPKLKAKPSLMRVDKVFDNIRYMLALCDTIDLRRIDFLNNTIALRYRNGILRIATKDYTIAGELHRDAHTLAARVTHLHVPAYRLDANGTIRYDYDNDRLEGEANATVEGVPLHLRAVQQDRRMLFAVNSDQTGSITALVKQFRLPPSVVAWITKKIRAKAYKLDYLKGLLTIDKQGAIHIDPDTLQGAAHLTRATVRFHPKLPAATATRIDVRYAHRSLVITPHDARYLGRDLNGTRVAIRHLGIAHETFLKLDLYAISDMQREVHDILHAYGLTIPVRHSGKSNRAHLTMRIPLNDDAPIKSRLHVALDRGLVRIGGIALPLCGGGKVTYRNNNVHLSRVCVKEWWYKGTVDGDIDVRRHRARLQLHIDRLAIGPKSSPFYVLKRRTIPVTIDFASSLTVSVPDLALSVRHDGTQTTITMRNLSKLRPYVRHPIFDATGGRVTFRTRDGIRYDFAGHIDKKGCIFYGAKGTCFRTIPLQGTLNGNDAHFTLRALDDRFWYQSRKRLMHVRRLGIDLKRLLRLRSKLLQGRHKAIADGTMIVKGKQSEIRYERYRLVTDDYFIKLFQNSDIEAYGSLDGDVITFKRKKGLFKVAAHRIKDAMLHPLIGFAGLKGGRYTIKMQGDPDRRMEGRIIVEGGTLSDFKAYNNTMTFIHTVPTMKNLPRTGFSQKGFTIEGGVVDFVIEGDRLRLTHIYLKGKTASVAGKGTVDLKSKRLDIGLAVRTMKDFAKIVGNIPVVGYLLLGEDKSVTVGLKVSGTLQKPNVQTSVAKDILTMPFRILERVITAPKLLKSTPKLPDLPSSYKSVNSEE